MDLVGQMSKKNTKFVRVLKVIFETIRCIQIKVYTHPSMEPKNWAFYSNNEVSAHGFSWSNDKKKVLSLSKYLKEFLRQFGAYKSKYILKPIWSQKLAHFTPITKSGSVI